MKKMYLVKGMLMIMTLALSTLSMNAEENKKELKEVTFQVAMDCQSCADKITKNLSFEKGVKEIKADVTKQTVYIKYRADKSSHAKLKDALKKLGYEAKEVDAACKTTKKACCVSHDH